MNTRWEALGACSEDLKIKIGCASNISRDKFFTAFNTNREKNVAIRQPTEILTDWRNEY